MLEGQAWAKRNPSEPCPTLVMFISAAKGQSIPVRGIREDIWWSSLDKTRHSPANDSLSRCCAGVIQRVIRYSGHM